MWLGMQRETETEDIDAEKEKAKDSTEDFSSNEWIFVAAICGAILCCV